MYNLQGKMALITGAAQGIGFSVARKLLDAGANVSLSDISLDALEQAADQLSTLTGKEISKTIHYAQVDVSRSEQIGAWIHQVAAMWSTVDIMVNNAGVQLIRPSLELTDEDWRNITSVDLDGVFFCAREAGKMMVKQGSGCIINISSIAEKVGLPQRLPYCVAKSGVSSLTRVLAAEWAEHGIRVNAVAPGYVRTELLAAALEQGKIELSGIVSKIPMGKLTEPDQIAEMVLFLVSDAAAYITGQVIFVDGGYSISK